MQRTIIVRTHYYDTALEEFIASLAEIARIVVVTDESNGPVAIKNHKKVSLTSNFLTNSNLFAESPQVFWRCGDYALYAARQALEDQDFFWMIEPDVRLSFSYLTDFFDFFDANSSIDFLAANLHPADVGWDWAEYMKDDVAVWQCLFPLVRISGMAIDFLYAQRQKASAAMYRKNPLSWPNDEAFVATTLANNGFKLADFNEFGTFYNESTFSFWKPIREADFQASRKDGLIYHPVLSGTALFKKLFYVAHCTKTLPGLKKLVAKLVGQEWSGEQASIFYDLIDGVEKILLPQ